MQARVADPTGTFRVTADWQNPDAIETLGYIEPPAFVAVTGQAALTGSGSRVYATIDGEALSVVGRTARDLWMQKTAGATLERLEALKEALSGTGDERAITAIGLYGTTGEDIRGMAGMVRTALGSLRPGSADTLPVPGRDLFLSALGDEGSGIPIDDAVALGVCSGLSAREARRALEELLTAGECYQPTAGMIKLI